MKVGLIGHRGAGKTTIFNMLTGLQAQTGGFGGKAYAEAHGKERYAIAGESDFGADRVWRFSSQLMKSEPATYAQLTAALAPLGITKNDKGEEVLTDVAQVDDPAERNTKIGTDFDTSTDDPSYRLDATEDATYRLMVRDQFGDGRQVFALPRLVRLVIGDA